MPQVTVIVEDSLIGVDGHFLKMSHTFPESVWAIQWDGASGQVEMNDGSTQEIDATYIQEYIDAYNYEDTRLYNENKTASLAVSAGDSARNIRNDKLAETDWWALSDVTMTQAQTAYRQALRDLPSTSDWNPAWVWVDSSTDRKEHYAELTGVVWPTEVV